MDQWLIRTSSNMIAGPYLKDQLKEMIRGGKLSLADEICSGTGYWIFLHEEQELKKLLGIEFSEIYTQSKEKTQAAPPSSTLKARQNSMQEDSLRAEDITETTAILRTDRSQGKSPVPKKAGKNQGYAFWKTLLWALIGAALLLGTAIYQILNP